MNQTMFLKFILFNQDKSLLSLNSFRYLEIFFQVLDLLIAIFSKSKFSLFLCLLRYFAAEPHIAGSPRQKVLAEELVRRWKDEYGFDKVEMPMYEVLLSKPDMDKKTRVTLKYKNGTIIYQVKGEEQV